MTPLGPARPASLTWSQLRCPDFYDLASGSVCSSVPGGLSVAVITHVVHGHAHAGNALNVRGRAVLFGFDTAYWTPSIWDPMHLLNRAGTGANTRYIGEELATLFLFTAAEVDAALELQEIAAEIAGEHRRHGTYPAETPRSVLAAA